MGRKMSPNLGTNLFNLAYRLIITFVRKLSCNFTVHYKLIYQLDEIEYLFVYFQCSATRHQHTHSSEPIPNYTKDTICCICKEFITSIAPEDGRAKSETCRAESTQINTQLHQVGKLTHNSNQNARYNYPKFTVQFSLKFVHFIEK